jgi:two-component system, chemotaxis family, protein-glutamate methylesterase/glutaminase
VIRVAVADDSPFTCRLLSSYMERAGDCEVVGTATDAATTLDLVTRTAPDVLTLDLFMPGANGLELLKKLALHTSMRIVVISGITRRAAATTLRALECGAVDFVLKYTPGAPVNPASLAREIIAKVRAAATAQPAARQTRPMTAEALLREARIGAAPAARSARPIPSGRDAVIVLGASTGGPAALRDVLAELPQNFGTPCVIVQHLPAQFTGPFAEQLERHLRLRVAEATTSDRLEPGRLLVSPGARHLVVRRGGRIELKPPADQDLYRPSIDVAMTSAAEAYNDNAVGIVLTGMGSDGAAGLSRIRTAGGVGCVQDPSTCLVSSMPARALELAGADYVGAPGFIGSLLAARAQR